jgi:hypothetical protein
MKKLDMQRRRKIQKTLPVYKDIGLLRYAKALVCVNEEDVKDLDTDSSAELTLRKVCEVLSGDVARCIAVRYRQARNVTRVASGMPGVIGRLLSVWPRRSCHIHLSKRVGAPRVCARRCCHTRGRGTHDQSAKPAFDKTTKRTKT